MCESPILTFFFSTLPRMVSPILSCGNRTQAVFLEDGSQGKVIIFIQIYKLEAMSFQPEIVLTTTWFFFLFINHCLLPLLTKRSSVLAQFKQDNYSTSQCLRERAYARAVTNIMEYLSTSIKYQFDIRVTTIQISI